MRTSAIRRGTGRADHADRTMGRARHDGDPEPRLRVSRFPLARIAWPNWRALADVAGPFIGTLFAAVIVGIVEAAMATAGIS